jgi:hypothetical protein
MSINIWYVFILIAYVVVGFGAVNIINQSIKNRPKFATFIIWPLLLAIFAFSDLDKWD